MKYKAVIFDLDGVICSTDRYHYLAWKKIAEEIGVYFDESVNNRLRGVSRAESLDIILEAYNGKVSDEKKRDYMSKKNALYRHLLEGMSLNDLDPEVKTTLDQIRAKGIKMAIGSSSKNTKYILKQIGLDDYFDAVSDGNNIMRSKPDPEVFLKASNFLGISPGNCLVVEDAKSGIEAAIAAKMDCAAIGNGTKYHLANYDLENFSGLLDIL
ncbi:MAG: beta-phosphoglucomutase [Eubacteriales bacterium]|nr:beta-phosphoglucomutase [Eubacteriales bacterium]